MNEIINAIPEYVITAVISTAFYFGVKEGQLLIRSKIQHAKTATARERWILTGQLAADAVNSLVGEDMAGHEKFAQATQIVQSALDRQGIKNVDLNAIETAIQAAYEKSPLTLTKQPVDPVKEAIKTAPNRANKLLVTDGSITQAKG